MKKYHIGTSSMTNIIYGGRVKKNTNQWLEKEDLTAEALFAVAEHVVEFGDVVKLTIDNELKYEITVKKIKG